MKDFWVHFATVFAGFFAIMNPLANTPVFLALTGDDARTRRAVALRALALTFAIIVGFSVMGKLIFQLFGLTMPALRIAGGVLVFKIGFDMLHGDSSKPHTLDDKHVQDRMAARLSVAISPLAVPLLAGPGTIATAMNFAAGESYMPIAMTIVAFGVLCVLTYIAFISGERLVALIGTSALNIVTRLMGLILAVIGTQMAIEGIQGAFNLTR
jgi:multiple antibiotic resistance protein